MARNLKRHRGSSPDGHTDEDRVRHLRLPEAADRDNLEALKQKLAAMNKKLQTVSDENAQYKLHIFSLSNRLSAAEFECKQIRESASKAAEHGDNVLMLQDLRYENLVLKGHVAQVNSQRKIIALAATDSVGPSDRTIEKQLELIVTDLKDACASVTIKMPPASVDISGEIDSWAQRIARCSFGQLLPPATDTDDDDAFYIVRALASAGITELVFKSPFPDFLAEESPLLDQYRSHILAKAGAQTLCELDLLAYHSVMSEEYYESRILQDTAKSLAEQFSGALVHVISPNDWTSAGAV